MGPRPKGTSLDRIDSNGNYEPSNCRWASAATQSRNSNRNRYFEVGGERMVMTDWARRIGVDPGKFRWWIVQHGFEAAMARFSKGDDR
jgi:hypothetical protein